MTENHWVSNSICAWVASSDSWGWFPATAIRILTKRQTCMWDVHLVNKLNSKVLKLEHPGVNLLMTKQKNETAISVLRVCFSCCWNITTPAWMWLTSTTSRWHTYMKSAWAIRYRRWLGKCSRSIETFFLCVCVSVRAASPLLKNT